MTHPKKSQTLHVENVGEELSVYDWQRQQMHSLNPTAASVFELCDGETSPEEMAENLDAPKELIWQSLGELEKAKLLEVEAEKPSWHEQSISRRQFLKVGSAVAAAAIVSIMLPSPAAAQSAPPPATNIVLYNAGQRNGALGGRAGADALCAAAIPAGYTTSHAFISISAGDTIAGLPIPTNLPIVGPTGTQIFANRADMLDGDNPPQTLFASGVTPSGGFWWSASDDNGGYKAALSNCTGFTDGTGGESGFMGDTDPSFTFGAEWINSGGSNSCDNTFYLLCIAY
ncbi:MAG: PqqD family peptide modification chaperone [Chloroflexi bacterium]|nr:PqqD family peptide modification chaperone [Chloroflexota bacterium]